MPPERVAVEPRRMSERVGWLRVPKEKVASERKLIHEKINKLCS